MMRKLVNQTQAKLSFLGMMHDGHGSFSDEDVSEFCASPRTALEEARLREARQGRLARIVKSPRFDAVVSFIIVLNAAIIGLQTQVKSRQPLKEDDVRFQVSETVLSVIFLAELLARIVVFRLQFFLGPESPWNIFDSVVVAMAVVEEAVKYLSWGGDSTAVDGMSTLRLLRLIKLARVLRIIRMFRFFRELRIMVLSIVSTIRSLFWTLVLLVMVMFVLGTQITVLVTNHEADCNRGTGTCHSDDVQPLFGSLLRTILTLYQAVLGGMDWGEVSDDLARASTLASCIFIFYVTFVEFAIMNIVTGLFVDQAKSASDRDMDNVMRNEREIEKMLERFFKRADRGGTGSLSWLQIHNHIQDETGFTALANLNLNEKDMKTFFDLLADAEEDAHPKVKIHEFVSGCIRLKHTNADTLALRYEVRKLERKIDGLTAHCGPASDHVTEVVVPQKGS